MSASIENSAAHLYAVTASLRTGSPLLDRLLLGAGFLDAESFPCISFRADMLVGVPTGWRAGGQLRVKGTDHPLVCELDADLHDRPGPPAMTVTTRWVIDSTWITNQRVPALSRRIAMTCSVALDHTHEPAAGPRIPVA